MKEKVGLINNISCLKLFAWFMESIFTYACISIGILFLCINILRFAEENCLKIQIS